MNFNSVKTRTLLIIAGILVLTVFACLIIYSIKVNKNDIDNGVSIGALSPKDATYIIDSKQITLKNGVSEVDIVPNSASKIITRYFGNEVKYDFDGDGREDTAFLLTQSSGGSGLFYYVAVALNTMNGYVGSRGLFIGDRIAPQTTNMKGNILVVNYADRAPGESFAVQPSMGKSLYLLFDPKIMQFGEVVQNFEGEADPARMTLSMKTWNWISTIYNDGKTIKPDFGKTFTLTFKNDNTFSAKTDCNNVGGKYVVSGDKITFGKIASTMMYCENSQEGDFTKILGEIQSYHFTSKGELIFDLKFDSGSAVFK